METLFRQFRIQYRVWFMLSVAFLSMALLIFVTLKQERDSFYELKKSELENVIQTTLSMLEGLNGQIESGQLSEAEAKQQGITLVQGLRFGKNSSDYFWLMDLDGNYLMHPIKTSLAGRNGANFKDSRGIPIFDDLPGDLKGKGYSYAEFYWPRPGASEGSPKMGLLMSYKPWGWAVGSGFYMDDIEDLFWSKAVSSLTIASIIIIVMFVGSWLMARSITRPLEETTAALKDISEGEGDLTRRLSTYGNDEIAGLTRHFNSFVDRVHQVMIQVNNASSSVSSSADRLRQITDEGSQNISLQAKETDQVASAVAQMSSTVHEVAQNAGQAASGASQADQEAQAGKQQVQNSIDAINTLSEQVQDSASVIQRLRSDSDNIGTVLDVIRGIAEQTNLLALNAAIEAARAGEQGRGFAVVADEVRTLAQRTQESTDEIQAMISRLQSAAQDAVKAMDLSLASTEQTVSTASEAGQSLDTILQAVSSIREMNDMIASAAEEQSIVAEEINRNVVNIVNLSQVSADSTQKVNSASEDLALQSDSLHDLVRQFKI